MTNKFFASLLYSITIALFCLFSTATITYAQKDATSTKHERFIKEDGKTNRSQSQNLFKKHFNTGADDEMVFTGAESDALGFTHDRYQQYYKKVKVEGAIYSIHSKNNMVQSLSGEFKGISSLNVTPTLSASLAFDKALAHINAKIYAWDASVSKGYPGYAKPSGELVVYGGGESEMTEPKIAWKFDIYAAEPLYRAWIYVDAQSGKILFENHRIHNTNAPSTGTTLYNGPKSFTTDYTGTGYRLRQTSSGNGVETYSMNNGTSYAAASDVTSATSIFTLDPTANQAHWGAEQTYEYFKLKHNRNSFDGLGAVIKSYVHYSANYDNAYWDGSVMTYGDGASWNPLVSLDICGHEITHAVTERTANLVYSYESGALNESFSDIFGEAIENYAKKSNDWLIGNDIIKAGSTPLRSMANPNLYGDPDTYKGLNWYSGTLDNGGVHYNSGVQNKWFYILTLGEAGTNDFGNTYNVTGIGIENAARIAYRTLTTYLTASSGYAEARTYAIIAAIDLFGAGSPEVIATTNAWFAVGVGCNYDGTVCSPVFYCSSQGSSQKDEWIGKVQIGSFTNTTGASSYTYFSANTISLNIGQSHNLTLTPSFALTAFPEYWRMWIDYNGDKDFEDAGELVYDAGTTSTTAKTGSFTVPATATGSTRMRISMKYSAAPTACESFGFGEVEDYPVTFVAPTVDTQAPTAPVLSSPSKTATSINLSWTASTDNVGVTGYDVYVNNAKNNVAKVTTRTYTVSGLTASTNYSIYVKALDAAANSANSNTLSVTTNAATTCLAPTGLIATSNTGTAATLTWAAVSGASSYKVEYRKVSVTVTQWTVAALSNTSRSISLSGLTPLTAYDWRVTTTCSGTVGGVTSAQFHTVDSYEVNNTASNAKIIKLATNILGSVHNATDQDWFKFTISKTATAKNLRITLRNMPADYDMSLYNSATSTNPIGDKVVSGSGVTRTVTITYNTTAYFTYFVKVSGSAQAFSAANSYTMLATASSTAYPPLTATITSARVTDMTINEDTTKFISLYPVPAINDVTISYLAPENGTLHITLLDITGRTVNTQKNNVLKGNNILHLNTSRTPNGIFLIKTVQNNLITNSKIVIRK